MKKIRVFSLLLAFIMLLSSLPLRILATETTEPVVPEQTEETVPYEEPPEVAYGGAPITNGCRTINGMTPLGGTDKILKSAQAAFIYEINTETVIYAYNPDMKMQPGTFTKLVVAIVALENGNVNQYSVEDVKIVPNAERRSQGAKKTQERPGKAEKNSEESSNHHNGGKKEGRPERRSHNGNPKHHHSGETGAEK